MYNHTEKPFISKHIFYGKKNVQTYFEPMSSSVVFFPSTIVNPPIPGSTRDLRISVPRPVAFIRQT